jgi:hypothetical protein
VVDDCSPEGQAIRASIGRLGDRRMPILYRTGFYSGAAVASILITEQQPRRLR